ANSICGPKAVVNPIARYSAEDISENCRIISGLNVAARPKLEGHLEISSPPTLYATEVSPAPERGSEEKFTRILGRALSKFSTNACISLAQVTVASTSLGPACKTFLTPSFSKKTF